MNKHRFAQYALSILLIILFAGLVYVVFVSERQSEAPIETDRGQEEPADRDTGNEGKNTDPNDSVESPDRSRDNEQPGLNASSCEAAGGAWNACGSACRGQDTDVCIEVCVPYCECETQDQCPAQTSCQQFIDGVGVCQPVK